MLTERKKEERGSRGVRVDTNVRIKTKMEDSGKDFVERVKV